MVFEPVIWNIRTVPEKELLIIEIRNEAKREVTFSALNYRTKSFLWQNLLFEERWWISLLGTTSNVVLLQIYDDVQNPERKSLLAIDIVSKKVLWKLQDFSLASFTETKATGRFWQDETDSTVIDLSTGVSVRQEIEQHVAPKEIPGALYPFQYLEGNSYFETVKKFLRQNFRQIAVMGMEYLEFSGLIIISFYTTETTGLANYLLVLQDNNGEHILTEKLGEGLKGLGVETFFVLSQYLFFVKNKREILSYRIL